MYAACNAPAQRGFTLLEVLIAISIFAIIGVGAQRVLHAVVTAETVASAHTLSVFKLQRAMLLLGMDLQQIIDRPATTTAGNPPQALVTDHDRYLLTFTRQGWRNPPWLAQSNLRQVAYSLERDTNAAGSAGASLVRRHWSPTAQVTDKLPASQALLDNVMDVRFRFLDRSHNWHSTWPLKLRQGAAAPTGETPPGVPVAVEITIETAASGLIKRVFQTGAQ
ncbi:MAG: type II secretion system minor pseudopilin GspJ [Gammaproteobacteria bacterium]|nr:type II secretion system minor pseudopilin GspJ [Gammaproteobacteria bacterium]